MWTIKFFCRIIIFVFTLILVPAMFAIAAPTITANPNPVVILFTEKSGTTTIQWDAEANHPNAQVWLSIDGGSETLFDGDSSGARTATIQLAKTYIFKLYTGSKSNLLDSVTVTLKRKYVTLPSDTVAIGFFDNVVEHPHGMFASITFNTDSSVLPVVMVSDKPPLSFASASKEDEQVFNQSDLISSNFAQAGTTHEAILPDLEPNTEYHYVISAHDNNNDWWFKTKGTFRTLQRAVAVKFEKIKVVDDSDDLSPGELSFGFFVNGKNKPNVVPLTFEAHLDTGESRTMNITATLSGIPATLQLKAIGYDDDGEETPYPGADFECLKPDVVAGKITDVSETEGVNDCGEWSSDDDSFNIGPNAPDVTDPESFTKSFTLKAYPKGDDSDVSFDVTGTYSVAYVP